jgi:hypothetical protein
MRAWQMACAALVALAGASGFHSATAQGVCTVRLDRYQAVVNADHRTGNVNDSVYGQIEHELSRAAQACAAGHDGEALSLIRQSEIRHGYHT